MHFPRCFFCFLLEIRTGAFFRASTAKIRPFCPVLKPFLHDLFVAGDPSSKLCVGVLKGHSTVILSKVENLASGSNVEL